MIVKLLAAFILTSSGCDYPPPGAWACEYAYAGFPRGPWIAFRVWSLPRGRIFYLTTGGLT